MSADAGRHWTEAVLGDEMDTHDVEPETYCQVHYHCDGSATFDEGWGGAWIETETLVQLEAWR